MTTSFDERARGWDSDPFKVERAERVAEAIRAAVPLAGGFRALEYGCGTGLLSVCLHPYLGHVTLADSSEGMLAVLAEKIAVSGYANMIPLKLDLITDPLPAGRFDLIYTLMTMHHIPDTDGILAKFHALTEPGGWLCIADLKKEDGSFHGAGFEGHNGFARESLANQVRAAGFADVKFSFAYEMTKEVNGAPRKYPIFLMTAQKKI